MTSTSAPAAAAAAVAAAARSSAVACKGVKRMALQMLVATTYAAMVRMASVTHVMMAALVELLWKALWVVRGVVAMMGTVMAAVTLLAYVTTAAAVAVADQAVSSRRALLAVSVPMGCKIKWFQIDPPHPSTCSSGWRHDLRSIRPWRCVSALGGGN
jgi:hypothetical protein